ncbi:unnamed protein product [Lepeophtheirus salmonis]|uniref:(salmon louse) hypothetical protein n=1 Tax=Lepeophtheirus salmonis TaxID=72036 RepID=A0A7R8HFF9_LEPSM|nr:unnamed protein product [Lepeophtheirus salmonis]CAF3043819.1 unnamed protein product [Lepeophtheirus salmonis]
MMEDFKDGPLMTWLRTFPDVSEEVTFLDLINGNVLLSVLQSFESEVFEHPLGSPSPHESIHQFDVKEFASKVQKFEDLIRSLKYYYEEVLGQMVIIKLPNSLLICEDPPTKDSLVEMDRLLLLILGAAVQCSQKETVIQCIKNLPVAVQEAIVIKIKEVTDNPTNVWTSELNDPSSLVPNQRDLMYVLLVSHVKKLVKERDEFARQMVGLSASAKVKKNSDQNVKEGQKRGMDGVEEAVLGIEIRKLNQELNDKNESLAEASEDNQTKTHQIRKLKQENLQLVQEARNYKCHQDELDILQERAAKVDKLEADILVYKDKANQLEYCKSRFEDYKEDNRILTEAKVMLVEQLEQARTQNDKIKINDLIEENMSLSLNTKNSLSESQSLLIELQSLKNLDTDSNVLAEQLGKDLPKIHRLEIENQHLKTELEKLQVEGFHALSGKILDLEKENKKYSLEVTHLKERINRETDECEKLEKELVHMKDKCKQHKGVIGGLKESEEQIRIEKDTEVESLKSQISCLRKRQEQSQNEQINLLTEENQKLTKDMTEIRRKTATLESEKKKRIQNDLDTLKEDFSLEKKTLSLEISKEGLDSAQENLHLKYSNSRMEINTLMEEARKKDSEISSILRERNEFKAYRSKYDEVSKSLEEMNSKHKSLETEFNRTQRQVQNLKNKVIEVESLSSEVEQENKKLTKQNHNLKETANKVEKLEKDNIKHEADYDLIKRINESLTKEVERAKDGIELRDVTIEEQNSKFSNLERENDKLNLELRELQEKSSKLKEIEEETRNLNQKAVFATKTCITLREKLVKEKVMTENLAQEIDFINDSLIRRFGFDKEALKSNENIDLSVSNERNIFLENKVKELSEIKHVLQNEIELLQIKVDGGDAKSEIEKQLNVVLKEKEAVDTEVMNLKLQISQLENKVSLFQTEKAHINQELVKLTEDRASLQVENTTLNSQSAMLLNQINQLQSANTKLDTEREKWGKLRKVLNSDKESLIIDQERLQKLHEIRRYQTITASLDEDQNTLLRAKKAIDIDRENLRTDARTLSNLRSEHARLKEDFRSLFTSNEKIKQDFCGLQTDYKTLKTLHNKLMLEHTAIRGENELINDKNVTLEIDNDKLINKCEVLVKLNDSLEDDRKGLMSQVKILLSQYHELLTQALSDKEHYHEEEKVYNDRVHNLARQKEKLEEKIFEQYKKMESYTPKKSGFGSQIVQKMRKASSHLMLSKSRPINSSTISNNAANNSSSSTSSSIVNVRPRGSHRNSRPGPILEDGLDSSSLGSGGNDSLDSGSHSPNQPQNSVADSRRVGKFDNMDGDNVSINSIVSSSGHSNTNAAQGQNYYADEIPTRDIGSERLFNHSSQGDVGLPNVTLENMNNRSSHRYFNNDRSSSSDRSSTPRLASWKSDHSSPAPSNGSQENGAPPIKPRKTSGVPPKRPPKSGDISKRVKSENSLNGHEFHDNDSDSNKSKILSKKNEKCC